MGLLDTYRINKAIAVLLTSQDAASAETLQAVATLNRFGKSALPKLVEALGKVRNPQTLVALLAPLVQNATLPLFGDGLASSNARIVAGVVDALTQASTYDPNRLLDFFTDPRIAKGTLGKLLVARKETLQPALLLRCLDTVRPEDRPLLLGLVRHVATVATVPALIRHTASADETVRLAMVCTLTRFHTEEVREALLGMLADPHGRVREAALEGLASLQLPLPVGPICQLLRDPEQTVRRQASLLLIQRKDPQTIPYLFDILQDPSPEVQQGAIELLSVVGDASTVQAAVTTCADTPAIRDALMHLLAVPQTRVRQLALEGLASLPLPLDVDVLRRFLWDPDRTIRQQATALLTPLNAPQTLPVLIETLQAKAADVRQAGVTILNANGDAQLIKELLSALRDKEWWVTTRVTEALGRGGGAKVVEAALQLSLNTDAYIRRGAIEILKLSQDPQVLNFLVDALDSQDPWVKICAAEAAAALNDKRAVPALLRLAQTGDTDICLMALRALTTLGDARPIPTFLTHLHQGTPAIRQEALRALATVTDAERAGAVLQAVLAVRSTSDAHLKALANSTASTLVRRFGERAIGTGTSPNVSTSRLVSQSLFHESTPDSRISAVAMGTPAPVDHTPDTSSDTIVSEPMLDATALEPGRVLAERYRVMRRIGQGGFGTVVLVEDYDDQ